MFDSGAAMNRFRFFSSLKTRLMFWFVIIFFVPLVAMTASIYFERVKVARSMMFEKLSVAKISSSGSNQQFFG